MRKLALIALIAAVPMAAQAQGIKSQAARIAANYGFSVDANSITVSQAARIVQAERQGRRGQGFDAEAAVAIALGRE